MDINAETVAAGSTQSAVRLDRQQAEARQGRWMLELEREMSAETRRVVRVAVSVPAGQNPAGAAAPAPASFDAVHIATGENEARLLSRAAWALAPAPLTPTTVHAAHSLTSSVADAAGYAAMTASSRTDNTRVSGVVPPDWSIGNDARSERLQSLALIGQCGQTRSRVDSGKSENNEPARAVAETRSAQLPVFEKRLLSVFVGQDGVHAFIRDRELASHDLHRVSLALSAELSASGYSLAGLTINGKRVESRSLVDAKSGKNLLAAIDVDNPARPLSSHLLVHTGDFQ